MGSADTPVVCLTATLELKAAKYYAHSRAVGSLAYSPDDTKIVSCGADRTIKVWDAGAFWATKCRNALLALADASRVCLTATLELKEKKENAHNGTIFSVAYLPDGTKIVSGSCDNSSTIKVWDADPLSPGGAFYATSKLVCVAVSWPRLVAGAQSGELYHLEVEEGPEF